MLINVGCGPHLADRPWINVDLLGAEVPADIYAVPGDRLPFDDGCAAAVYAGHVLEHVPWDDVGGWLADVARVLAPGGRLCVVGPDVFRAIRAWHEGAEPWELVESVLEHDRPQEDLGAWAGARHSWNCTEARVAAALRAAGFVHIQALPIDGHELDGWPIVSRSPWQCAVVADRRMES